MLKRIDKAQIPSHTMPHSVANWVIPAINELIDEVGSLREKLESIEAKAKAPQAKNDQEKPEPAPKKPATRRTSRAKK